MNRNITLFDIADALGISTGTVHRALHDHPGVSPMTRTKVLQMAKKLGYRPNLAARFLSSRRAIKVSINTLKGTTSFWDEVRAGIAEEAKSLLMENIELQFRTYPKLGEGEEEAFAAALKSQVDGIVVFPSSVQKLRPWIARASRQKVPVICVVTDAADTARLAVVSIDAAASGALAADLMGRLLNGNGKVAATLSTLAISEHVDKCRAFESTLQAFYPNVQLIERVEDHDVEPEAYEKCRQLFQQHPDLSGIYVTTEASIPVVRAARDAQVLDKLTIIATDLFPALVKEIRSGAVLASIYQRPRTQGRMAFRALHEFLAEGQCPPYQITLAPHLVMRGNLKFFLERQLVEKKNEREPQKPVAARGFEERFA